MNRATSLSLLLLGLLFNTELSAQMPQKLQNNLKMVVDGDTLPSSWGGGMNAPQFAEVDFDKDGMMDMLVFDREDNSFSTYLNVGSRGNRAYEYAPYYEEKLIECECENFALTADYNCDGKLDIVCGNERSYGNAYKQVEKNGEIFFVPEYIDIKTTLANGSFIPVFFIRQDVPAIVDVDDDGDIDILTWRLGFNYIEYHRNYAMEDFGRCDTFHMKEESGCFGHFFEGGGDNSLILHDTSILCPLQNFVPRAECSSLKRPLRGGGIPVGDGRHIGSTTLALDLDADGIKDLLIGDVSFNDINAAYNCGRLDYAYMDSSDGDFPSYDLPINMGLFPATFYVDVDNDNIRDLIVATNELGRAENKYSTQLYLNKGADDLPDFKYKGRAFMQMDNVDQGSAAAPVFFDYNDDGLLDLLVGDGGVYDTLTKISDYRLKLYRNVGDHDVPIFELVDDDYLGFGGGNIAGARLAPAVGDLNGDGDRDLLIGTADGTIMYFENTAGAGNTAQFTLANAQLANIDIGSNAAPFLYDIDGDIDLDLFIGNLQGKVAYYENTGTVLNFSFTKVTEEYGFIQAKDDFGDPRDGNTRPIILDYDNDNEVEMLVGNIRGEIEIYENLHKALTDTLRISSTLFIYDFGSYAAPAAAVLDSTGDFTFVVGIERGGLKLFNSLPDELPAPVSIDRDFLTDFGIRFYPNPAQNGIWVEVEDRQGKDIQLRIINTLGQQLSQHPLTSSQSYIDIEHLAQGMYLLRFEVEGRSLVKKLVKD
jgi:hypothetical protein